MEIVLLKIIQWEIVFKGVEKSLMRRYKSYNIFQIMDYQFLLMRHAYSRHNLEKDQWKQRFGGKSYKTLNEYRISKFAPELIDSPQIDQQQVKVNAESIDFSKIGLILCSPLRRCLQTCKLLVSGVSGLTVVVDPKLSSRLSAAWSIGSSAHTLQKEYADFDFSAFQEAPNTWMVDLLSHLDRISLEQMAQRGFSMQQYLLNKVSTGQSETYEQFFQRTRNLKGHLARVMNKYLKPENDRKEILIIAHSCVLSFLLGNELNQKGKVKDKISFEHCQPLRFSGERVLSCDGDWNKVKYGKL